MRHPRRRSLCVGSLLASLLLPSSWCVEAAADETASAAPAPVVADVGELAERVSFAVVIGNNKSLGRRRPELRYADDDAARYFEIFQTIAPGRVSLLAEFDRDTERLFPDVSPQAIVPNRANLARVGEHLSEQVRAARAAGHETDVYFIFAGHGDVERGEGFIEMSDARFRSGELEAFLRSIPFTRGHVILDSCNSFFMLGVRKPGGRHFATSEDAARALAERLPNVGVFLSTSAEGEAFEWSEIQSGIFSHVVRSGLLGGADANSDGSVSYLELAAFVHTSTAEVRNPNMRPHVFARGPGASDETPIARLRSLTAVRRFELSDAASLRLRLRDATGLPLLDAHTEPNGSLDVWLPEAWAQGAVVERAASGPESAQGSAWRRLYTVPQAPETVTLAALQDLNPRSAVRGPDETFQTLFARPFGPLALASYVATRSNEPAPIFGVTQQDAERMDLLLQQLARSERGRRVTEGLGGLGFGSLIGGAGIGVLHFDRDASADEKTEAKVMGGVLLGLGGLFMVGGAGGLLSTSKGEEAAAEFRRAIEAGVDPARAFAVADRRLQELAKERLEERYAAGFVGTLVFVGSTTGLIWSELAADEGSSRMAPRLGWGGGMVVGGLLLAEGLLTTTPVDTVTKIWRDDPSLNQYQPTLAVTDEGAFVSLTGTF